MYTCSLERMKDKIKTFSAFGDAGHGGITRYSLSEAAIMARNEFKKRMEKIGAKIETDDLGDMYATLEGSDRTRNASSWAHTSILSKTAATTTESSASCPRWRFSRL